MPDFPRSLKGFPLKGNNEVQYFFFSGKVRPETNAPTCLHFLFENIPPGVRGV